MLQFVKNAGTELLKNRGKPSSQFRSFCLRPRRKNLVVFLDKENVGLRETPAALERCGELGNVVKAKLYCCSTTSKALNNLNLGVEIIPVEPVSDVKEYRRSLTDDAMLWGVDTFIKAEGNSSTVDAVCIVTDDIGICKMAVQIVKLNTNLEVINLIHKSKAEVTRSYSLDSYTGMFDSVHLYGNRSKGKDIWESDEVEDELWQYFKAAGYVCDEEERKMINSFNKISVPTKAMFKFSFFNQLGLNWDLPRVENVVKILQFCREHTPKRDPQTHVFVMSLYSQGGRNNKPKGNRKNRKQFLLEKSKDRKCLVEEFLVNLGYCQKDISRQVMQEFISRKHDRHLPKLRANPKGTVDEFIEALYDDLTNPELESNRCFWHNKEIRPIPHPH